MNQHLRDAIDHLHEGVQIIAPDWTYLYVNETAAHQGQRVPSELIGNRIQDCFPGIENTDLFKAMLRAMTSRAAEAFRTRFGPDSGHSEWFDVRVEPVPSGICVLSINVSAEEHAHQKVKSLESQLQHAQKLESIGRLAGGIAHDFNNQLTVIRGVTELMLEDGSVPDRVRADLREIEAAVVRSAAITKHLLAFSRQQVLRTESVSLPDAVTRVGQTLSRLLRGNLRLEVQTNPDTDLILGEITQLENVLINLAVNAQDAMPDGGVLRISCESVEFTNEDLQHPEMQVGRYSALSVSDTGTGMDEATKAKIFEPFFTTKEAGKGTGLGLAMVYGVVKQMNGFIWVYSEVGRGTTFRLYFPVAEQTQQTAAPVEHHTAKREADSVVMVVDDDANVRQFIVRALQSAGYSVLHAASAETASKLLSESPSLPSLLLCDVVLPGMSGLAFVESASVRSVPFVLMSGYSRSHVFPPLATRHPLLEKPFTKTELLQVVRDSLLRSDDVLAFPSA